MEHEFKLPPADQRPDGLEVLAFHRGKWTHVKWTVSHRAFITGYGGPFIMEAGRKFAPIPEKPDGADGFFDYR